MSSPLPGTTDGAEIESFLDAQGLGEGPVTAYPIGDGHSNLTYMLERRQARLVLRRPPHGPLAPSANNVVREAKVLRALGPTRLPVPTVVAICEDVSLTGAPFYLMEPMPGEVISDRIPGPEDAEAPHRIAEEVVDMLTALHAVDVEDPAIAELGRPNGYLERQLQRFRNLLELNATRPLPDLERIADWLESELPPSASTAVVHGDYRLGNLFFATPGPRISAVLDWEMATLGDPLADVGYLTATWASPDDPTVPMLDLSPVTRTKGFPDRAHLARRYAEISGRSVDGLLWYEVLALWKAAIFLEGSYGRFLSGGSTDAYFSGLRDGVPALARYAALRLP